MERNDHPARQAAILFLDRGKKLQLIEISVHVLDGGNAVAGAIIETTPHHRDILRPFGVIGIGVWLAAGGQAKAVAIETAGGLQRAEGLHLPQLPCRQPSDPTTTSLPGPSSAPCTMPTSSSALVLAQAV